MAAVNVQLGVVLISQDPLLAGVTDRVGYQLVRMWTQGMCVDVLIGKFATL